MPHKELLTCFKEEALKKEFSVYHFCRANTMAYSVFYELIITRFNLSPACLAENYRLEESLRLMKEDNRLLKDIAIQSGYANYHTFHHAVKRR